MINVEDSQRSLKYLQLEKTNVYSCPGTVSRDKIRPKSTYYKVRDGPLKINWKVNWKAELRDFKHKENILWASPAPQKYQISLRDKKKKSLQLKLLCSNTQSNRIVGQNFLEIQSKFASRISNLAKLSSMYQGCKKKKKNSDCKHVNKT